MEGSLISLLLWEVSWKLFRNSVMDAILWSFLCTSLTGPSGSTWGDCKEGQNVFCSCCWQMGCWVLCKSQWWCLRKYRLVSQWMDNPTIFVKSFRVSTWCFPDALGATLTSHLDKPHVYVGCMKSGQVFSELWVWL